MTSAFGWLDQDDGQRAAMNEVVQLFQDKSSVDELGIGTVRDALSNHFFPGTSVLHTRIRYLLFVPWLLADATRRGHSVEQAGAELRANEVKLVKALLAGGMESGVIGSQAQDRLKTMPSRTYWPALQRLRLARWDVSVHAHLRRAGQNARRGTEITEDDAVTGAVVDLGLDRGLPARPDDLLTSTTFDLSPEEAGFLQGVMVRHPGGSLLSWLAARPDTARGERLWQTEAGDGLPEHLATTVDHARRLHHAWHGAPLLYNLMLARLTHRDDLVDEYEDLLDRWESEVTTHRVFDDWARPKFWAEIQSLNPNLRPSTQTFVDRWFDLLESGQQRGEEAQRLIATRELRLKGKRSRLQHAQARETWTPGAGTGRLSFRWEVARSFLTDISEGLGRTPAESSGKELV